MISLQIICLCDFLNTLQVFSAIYINTLTKQTTNMDGFVEDKYVVRNATSQKSGSTKSGSTSKKQEKHHQHVAKKAMSNQFLASWLEEKKTIVRREKAEQAERVRQALDVARQWKIQRRMRQIQEAKLAWEQMPDKERNWRLGLYEDMHYDHANGHHYARRDNDNYGVWEYYLDHANELWNKYGY